MLFVFVVFLYFTLCCAVADNRQSTVCSTLCTCKASSKFMRCENNGNNLTYIPAVPKFVNDLYFTGNFLQNVTADTFKNISGFRYHLVDISDNSMENIETGAFVSLTNIVNLYLGTNNAITQDNFANFFSGATSITINKLRITELGWTNVNPNSFTTSWKTLETLDISSNAIEKIYGCIFRNISGTLYHLKLNDNEITEIILCYLPKLGKLNLHNNRLTSFPNFCSNISKPLIPKLSNLNLGSNFISWFDSKSFACLHSLKKLVLNGNSIKTITAYTFSSLNKLQTLTINFNYRLKSIEGYAFSNSNLKTLSIQQNRFHFDNRDVDVDNVFSGLPMLKVLKVGNNFFPIEKEQFRNFFYAVPDLIQLNLQNIGLQTIPGGFLQMFPNLETLVLLNNKIYTWDEENPFENVTSLKLLNLDDNNIKLINKSSFPSQFLANVQHIILSRNRFSCTCDLKWFLDLLRKSVVNDSVISFFPYPRSYICDSPISLKRILLKDYYPSAESCHPLSSNKVWYMELVIAPSLAFVIVMATILTTYKCRWHIRYWIHVLRTKKSTYTTMANEDYVYDGFVIYGDGDREWVHNDLAKHLEKDYHFHLCLHYRDFDVGLLIVDNIEKHMLLSKRVIIVLSNNCAASEWCQFEVRIAEDRYLKGDNMGLVVIMLEELSAKNMTSVFKTLITSTTYAIWTDDDVGNNLFWEQVVTALRA